MFTELEVRRYIKNKLGSRAAINTIDIERSPNLVNVTITTAKAGVVIGRGGAGVAELKAAIEKIYGVQVRVNIEEVKVVLLAVFLAGFFSAVFLARSSPSTVTEICEVRN